jgi:hypothetical protein
MKSYRLYELLGLVLLSVATAGRAYGNVALFIEEPYGFFGSIVPMGHSAIYLNHVYAETPTILRRCRSGENGVVISRYSRVGKLYANRRRSGLQSDKTSRFATCLVQPRMISLHIFVSLEGL